MGRLGPRRKDRAAANDRSGPGCLPQGCLQARGIIGGSDLENVGESKEADRGRRLALQPVGSMGGDQLGPGQPVSDRGVVLSAEKDRKTCFTWRVCAEESLPEVAVLLDRKVEERGINALLHE